MKTMVLCNRVGDKHAHVVPGSVIHHCSACGHACWISTATLEAMMEHEDPGIVCVACGLERLPPGGMPITMSEAQKKEIREAGYDPEPMHGVWLRPPRYR